MHLVGENEKFGNGRFVRNIFEETCNLQALRLSNAMQPIRKKDLQCFTEDDIPIGSSLKMLGVTDIDAIQWTLNCPKCNSTVEAEMKQLGQTIPCWKCLEEMLFDWPCPKLSLDPMT